MSFGGAPHWRPLSSSFTTSPTSNGELVSALFASMSPPTALTSYPLLWQSQQQLHYQQSRAIQPEPEQMLHSTPIAPQFSCAAQFSSGIFEYTRFRPTLTPPPPLPSPPMACFSLAALQTGHSANSNQNPLSAQPLRSSNVLQLLANLH